MATTEITELQAATAFADGDLALIRKSGETKDRKISQSNLIKSIGNPAVKGFTATSDEANKVTLDPSNSTVIDTYYDGMEISFLSPINSTGLVQVRIGALAYKDIFVLNSAASVELTTTTYIQAIYSTTDNKFYQTNAATTQVFTNDYVATGVVAGDNSTTTYTLTSAYGISKTEYYTGMSIIFTSDVASKGGVLVNIDGLGNKVLTDKAGDNIANDLLADQVILAIYDGTNFIKNLFSETVPEAPELPADAFDEETGEIIPDNVPDDNKVTVTVGNAGNTYTTINDAINDLVDNFGNDGGNRLCTINLSNTYVWNEALFINSNLSWITIIANNNSIDVNPVTIPTIILINKNCSAPNIKGNLLYKIKSGTPTTTFCDCRGSISMLNAQLTIDYDYSAVNHTWFKSPINSNITLTDVTIDGGTTINSDGGICNINNIDMSSLTGSFIYGNLNGVITNLNTTQTANSSNTRIIDLRSTTSLVFNNCTIVSNKNGQTFNAYIAKGIILNNTSVKGVGQCLLAQSGSEIVVNGGDYRHVDNSSDNQNIISTGIGSIIRLTNNPQGGTLATNNGIISVE